MSTNSTAPVLGISRLRMNCDGNGIRTLIAFYGCPLKCRYCLNSECQESPTNYMTVQQLYNEIKIDDIYFRVSQGGVTFGGGEPLLYPQFINDFKEVCPSNWNITVETSLNIPLTNLLQCYKSIDNFIVDIKCLSGTKYESYTGLSNNDVWDNLGELIKIIDKKKIRIRIPHIPKITIPEDIEDASYLVKSLGITDIDQFDYILPKFKEQIISNQLHHGKEICNSLKRLRNTIALSNGLIIRSVECNYEGPCAGTCPRCDEELKTISQFLSVLERNNVKIHLKSETLCS